MCHISAYPLLSAYCHSVYRYKRMRLLTRVYGMTNPYKSSKICLHYASNGLARPTSIANTASLLATPIDLTHPLQAMCIRQLHTCMHTTAAALISMQNRCGCRYNVRRGMCSIKLKLFRSALGMGKIMRDPHILTHITGLMAS